MDVAFVPNRSGRRARDADRALGADTRGAL